MILYTLALLITIPVLLIYWRLAGGSVLFASAPHLFMFNQLLLLIGTMLAVDLERPDDRLWLGVIVGSILFFTIGAITANSMNHFRPRTEINTFRRLPMRYDLDSQWLSIVVFGGAFIALLVGIVYVRSVGYNAFFESFAAFRTSGMLPKVEYNNLRLRATTGHEHYVAGGYASQFFAILLPLLLYLMYFRVRVRRRKSELLLLLTLVGADFYFLTAAGSRGWILYAGFGFILLLCPFGPVPGLWKKAKRPVYVVLLIVGIYYGAATELMGRAEESGGKLEELYDRLVGTIARNHLELMRALLAQPSAAGANWWRDLASILPGQKADMSTANEMNALVIRGDTQGSIGLTPFGSFVYNWGTLGSIVFAYVIGYLMQRFTIWYVRGERTLTRVIILFVAGLRLALFRDPYSLFFDGFVTIVGFYFIVWMIYPKQVPMARVPGEQTGVRQRLWSAGRNHVANTAYW